MNVPAPAPEQKPVISQSSRWQYILLLFFILLFATLLYTFFHESGHALVGLFFGAKITRFSIDLNAHVSFDGIFTPAQQAMFSLAGPLLPVLLTVLFLLSVPKRSNTLLEWVKVLVTLISFSALLAWVALPWLYLAGQRPGDDSITFLTVSGFYPPLVSVGALLVFAGGLGLLLNRVEGLKGLRTRFTALPAEVLTPSTRRTLAVMVAVFVVVAGLAVGLGKAVGASQANFLVAPADYAQVAKIQLDERPLSAAPAHQFTLEQPASVSLFIAIDGLTRGPVKIALTGPNGYNNVFFTADEAASGNISFNPRDLPLEPGPYQVEVTFPQEPGTLTISAKIGSR